VCGRFRSSDKNGSTRKGIGVFKMSDRKSIKPNILSTKSTNQQAAKKKKKKKKTALVICRDRKEFWTTQTQFWQWVREGIVTKTGEQPLTGSFNREHEELLVLLSNTVLNLAHPNHMREALLSRKVGIPGK
jgi:hypothetical protein